MDGGVVMPKVTLSIGGKERSSEWAEPAADGSWNVVLPLSSSSAPDSVADPGKVAVCGMSEPVWNDSHQPIYGGSGSLASLEIAEEKLEACIAHMDVLIAGLEYQGGRLRALRSQDQSNTGADTPTMIERWRQEAVERLANQAEQIGALMCRNNQLERENAALRESRDYWVDKRVNLEASTPIATRSEAELVSRTFEAKVGPFRTSIPLNALKHSK